MTLALEVGIGLVIGLVVGALGGGGGVLTVPALVYLLGASTHEAATASLIIVGVAALAGLPARAWRGTVRWGAGAAFGLVGTAASLAGAVAARHLDPAVLLLAFAGIIAVAAVLMLRDARRGEDGGGTEPGGGTPTATDPVPGVAAGDPGPGAAGAVLATVHHSPAAALRAWRPRAARAVVVLLGGLAVGLMTGLFGVGGGFLAVPVLVLVLHWPVRVAIGTSLLVIVINATAALVPRLSSEVLDLRLVVPVTVAAVVGTVLGKLVSDRLSSPVLGRTFAVVLLLLAGYTAARSLLVLAA